MTPRGWRRARCSLRTAGPQQMPLPARGAAGRPPQASAREICRSLWLSEEQALRPPDRKHTRAAWAGNAQKAGPADGPGKVAPQTPQAEEAGPWTRHGSPGANGMWSLSFPGRQGQVQSVLSAFTSPPAACLLLCVHNWLAPSRTQTALGVSADTHGLSGLLWRRLPRWQGSVDLDPR